jgi:hypothetical protein
VALFACSAFGNLDAKLLIVGLAPGEKCESNWQAFQWRPLPESFYTRPLHKYKFATEENALGVDHSANPAMQLMIAV